MCCLYSAGSQESDSSQTAKKDMLAALRARQDALEDTLKKRLEELKNICIREAVGEKNTHLANILKIRILFRSSLLIVLVSSFVGADRKASEGIPSGSGRGAAHSATEDRYRLQTG